MARLPQYDINATPDLFSITPGYWHLYREFQADEKLRLELIAEGIDASTLHHLKRVATLSIERRADLEVRLLEVLTKIANVWPVVKERGAKSGWRTTIIFRALHYGLAPGVPMGRIATFDAISRDVLHRLFVESEGRRSLARHWRNAKDWTSRVGRKATESEGKSQSEEKDLGSRIILDNWGQLMIGQGVRRSTLNVLSELLTLLKLQEHFRDDMHPKPLPGSRVYGNHLLDMLRRVVEARESA